MVTIPYEAYVRHTGDIQIKVKGKTYFDYNDLYVDLDNYDIVSEDREVTAIVGAMTPTQFKQLLRDQDELIDIDKLIP